MKTLWFLSFVSVLLGEVKSRINKRDVRNFYTREKCMEGLGCFSAAAPFFDIRERLVSLLPDDREGINTSFALYTRDFPNSPMNFSNLDDSLDFLHLSDFNPHINTKFIVPGFISETYSQWKMLLKDALLFYEPCNVFYVDWSGGDGPLYEQAVANTRVVGAEIAAFIQKLQNRTRIRPESVHLIGHSLGAHIAGYAGKRLKHLGRITALDPAGPYFSNVEPVVRLDRGDALLVDAIHTNVAPTRFQGFGLLDSIAHFDFFPNGGQLQPGCPYMSQAIWPFLSNPTLAMDVWHDMNCSHGRAIYLFISSIMNRHCLLNGTQCDNWEKYAEGKCGDCSSGTGELCVPLDMYSIQYSKHINFNKSLNFYLNTTDRDPYCKQ